MIGNDREYSVTGGRKIGGIWSHVVGNIVLHSAV